MFARLDQATQWRKPLDRRAEAWVRYLPAAEVGGMLEAAVIARLQPGGPRGRYFAMDRRSCDRHRRCLRDEARSAPIVPHIV
jgi:hypothetical protein